VTKKASKFGFDWENAGQIFDKIREELAELEEAADGLDAGHIEEEIGDLLFAAVNLARRLDVEPETALKRTNRKFRRRFKFIEDELKAAESSLDEADLKQMDDLWTKAKAAERIKDEVS
jgi:ATP diphosphatase